MVQTNKQEWGSLVETARSLSYEQKTLTKEQYMRILEVVNKSIDPIYVKEEQDMMMLGSCCNCMEDKPMNEMVFCSECGATCCNSVCLEEHECDPEGDME